MRQFLAVLRSCFHSSLLRAFSCHPSPPAILLSSLTSYCHLFLGLHLNLVVPKFMYNTLLGILFSSILSTCPNQRNLFNFIVSIILGFLTHANFLHWLISSNFFFFHCHILDLKFFYTLSFQECSIAFYLSLLLSPIIPFIWQCTVIIVFRLKHKSRCYMFTECCVDLQ